jgi:peptide/nickel transport system permease protein
LPKFDCLGPKRPVDKKGTDLIAYIFRRLGAMVVILLGSSFLLYNLAATSGDPLADLRVSTSPNAKQQIASLTRTLQLDVPPPIRYFIWLKGVLRGFIGHIDFGMTRQAQPVARALATAIPTTIRLVFVATVVAIILGIAVGIVTALRQYSRFDYAMTFVAFLMFSLPIFWVAVLLKQFLAIKFNDFLGNPTVPLSWLLGLSVVSGVFWAAVIGGSRKKVWVTFGIATAATGLFLQILSITKWLSHPRLGPVGIFLLGAGIAFAMVQLSTGITNRAALRASLTMAILGPIMYFPAQAVFAAKGKLINFPLMFIATILVAVVVSFFFTKVDRGPVIRTTVLTALFVSALIVTDKFMHTWKAYVATDAVNYRPIPTTGQVNSQLPSGNFWFTGLDILVHLLLPTIALTLISFAGYIRYSRGTLLEVLNQDYIRTARAKGLTERTVIMRHAFRNTLIPLTTIMVVDFAGIIGGAIITERVFGWVGMGALFNQAVTTFDLNLLMGVFLVTGSLAVLANLAADLLYSTLDPRIRVGS